MKFATRLKNGAFVISDKWNEVTQRGVVLTIFENQFVTWKFDREGNTYLGHYFPINSLKLEDIFIRAVVDFNNR